jgi:phosphatidylserine/phosphatidylglycerophosphate/cardiolipin synthase-like enzyme
LYFRYPANVRPSLLLVLLLGARAGAAPALELIESAPVETTLDHADIPDAADVWPGMIDAARRSIDLSEFYVTSQPGGRLEPVLAALRRAVARGVKVRMVVDAGFAKKEPATVTELERTPGLEVRRFDWAARGGGVLHAKYFIVDGIEAYLGSQNFDWRSLSHIQEVGVRARVPAIASMLEDVFETDWALAGGAPPGARVHRSGARFPVAVDGAQVWAVASPRGWLPDEQLWDLPRIVELIDGARAHVRVQVLTYQAAAKAEYFAELETALRRAAARGVAVELLVSDWCKRKGCIEGLKSLAVLPNVAVRLLTIPPARAGFIPYARVAHAKYLVVDGARAWIGTGNWERDYFYDSRNVGVIVDGGAIPPRLDRFFQDDWQSAYAAPVDPAADYVAPRTHD